MPYKFVSILGFGISSIGAIRFLLNKYPEIQVRVSDLEPRESFDPKLIQEFELSGVQFLFASQSKAFISFDNQATKDLFIMISPGIPPLAPVIQVVKSLNVDFGTDFDLALRLGAFSEYLAITGTNGKTTTVSLTSHLLGVEALGNIGKAFMSIEDPKMIPVCELSSFQLFYSNIFDNPKYWPKVAVYLNITDDHLDWHSSIEEYQEAKAKLFNISDRVNNTLIFNYDDLLLKDMSSSLYNQISKYQGNSHTTLGLFSVEENFFDLDPILTKAAVLEDGVLYLLKYLESGQDPTDVMALILPNAHGDYICKIPVLKISDLKIVGKHNYSNVLAAILAADSLGLPVDQIAARLKSFTAFPHRLQYITQINGHSVYNDSKATNPDSTIKALESFDRSIIILGGKEKNLDLNKLVDVVIERAFAVVCFGEIGSKIKALLESRHFQRVSLASGLVEVLDQAVLFANESKNHKYPILFSPATSSFDMFDGYEDRGTQFMQIASNYSPAQIS